MSDATFIEWLESKLSYVGFDDVVFTDYIIGILKTDGTPEEKRESLKDILTSDMQVLCDEIFERWAQQESVMEKEKIITDENVNLDEKLAGIMERQAQSLKKCTKFSEPAKQMKEAILAQYSQVSDEENCDSVGNFESSGSSTKVLGNKTSIPANTNVHSVVNAEREAREKAKVEAEKKKVQDKLDREKQKQKLQERKEKETKRTQKGERRR